jgi:hypothetical protein
MISFFGSLRCSYRYTDAAFVVTYLYLHKTFAQMKIDAQKADAGEEMRCLLWLRILTRPLRCWCWEDSLAWCLLEGARTRGRIRQCGWSLLANVPAVHRGDKSFVYRIYINFVVYLSGVRNRTKKGEKVERLSVARFPPTQHSSQHDASFPTAGSPPSGIVSSATKKHIKSSHYRRPSMYYREIKGYSQLCKLQHTIRR